MMAEQPTLARALRYDDVVVLPGGAWVAPEKVSLQTHLIKDHPLQLPFIGRVTTPKAAIVLAQHGLIGLIDHSLSLRAQIDAVRQVKRYQTRVLRDPLTVMPDTSVAEAKDLQLRYQFSALPVLTPGTRQVCGIATRNDIAQATDPEMPVSAVMSTDLLTVTDTTPDDEIRRILNEQMVGQVLIVDSDHNLLGMRTASDFTKREAWPQAMLDTDGRLRVGAVIKPEAVDQDRLTALLDAGVDLIMVDHPFAHNHTVQETITFIRRQRSDQRVIVMAGAVQNATGARALIDAGADMVWVCGNDKCWQDSGVGTPAFTALQDTQDTASLSQTGTWVQTDASWTPAHKIKALAGGAQGLIISIPELDNPIAELQAQAKQLAAAIGQTGADSLKALVSYARIAIIG